MRAAGLVLGLWLPGASIQAALPAAVTNQPILFVVRKQYVTDHHNTHTMFPAAPNEYNNGTYTGGGGAALRILDPATGAAQTLLDAGPDGVIRDPDVHFTGQRVVFAWRKSAAESYHIWEINVDGSGLKQLTSLAGVDDFDPIYLADDRIVFVSGREPKYVMCNKHLSHNLYRMEADGANVVQIGKSTLFEGHPSLMPDGRILYYRWEYVDRDFGDAQGLWTVDPEGTGHAVFYGNNTSSPGGVVDGHAVPGTPYVVCNFVACHDRPWGAIALLDHRMAFDGPAAVMRTWPAGLDSWVHVNDFVTYDFDTFGSTSPKHEDPYPLVDPATGVGGRYFLCSRQVAGEHMAIYLLDARDGSETPVHDEGSGSAGCFDPMPLTAHPRPNTVTVPRKYDNSDSRVYIMDVYKGTHMTGVARGDVKCLRVVESPEKRYYSSQVWNAQGIEAPGVNWDSFETKRILGTVPVDPDGSAHFMVPANKFVFFQLLDANGMMIQSMRSGTIFQAGESQGCIGCHDNRGHAPHFTGSLMPSAFQRDPDTLQGWQGQPPKMFNYLADVQPVFDAKCMACHDYGGSAAPSCVLAADKGVYFNASYADLWRKGLTGAIGAGPAAIQQARSWGAHASRLVQALQGGHHSVTLSPAEYDRIVTWVDLNAVYYPSYAANYPDNAGGRSPLNDADLTSLRTLSGVDVYNIKGLGEQISFDRPSMSPCLSGLSGNTYTQALALIQKGRTALAAMPREDMTNCTLQCAMDIWRENKYQNRLNREMMNRAAVAVGGKVYDSQPLLAVANGVPTGVDGVSANINGSVMYSADNQAANVRIAWGTTDAGDDPNLWQHSQVVGSSGAGAFASTLSGLVPGQVYYYRVFATTAVGSVSSHLTGTFDTRSLIDLNGNGMADSWEIECFGGTNVPGGGPFEDWDGDGVCNLDEYLSGTDPTHANSCLKIVSFDYPAPDRLRIQWQSAEKCVYTISSSNDLLNWVEVSDNIAATPPANVVELPLGAAGRKFFRVGGRNVER